MKGFLRLPSCVNPGHPTGGAWLGRVVVRGSARALSPVEGLPLPVRDLPVSETPSASRPGAFARRPIPFSRSIAPYIASSLPRLFLLVARYFPLVLLVSPDFCFRPTERDSARRLGEAGIPETTDRGPAQHPLLGQGRRSRSNFKYIAIYLQFEPSA